MGVIGGTELPPVRRSFTAFEAGARRRGHRAGAHLVLGKWDDVGAGKEQALAQSGAGPT